MAQSITGDDPTPGVPFIDADGDQHFNATKIFFEQASWNLGTPEVVTIASGVATLGVGFFFALAAESSTSDQLDTITKADAVNGQLLLLIADTGDTITVDDANIDLGAATRAVGPGGCICLRYDGTSWCEVFFLAGADNS